MAARRQQRAYTQQFSLVRSQECFTVAVKEIRKGVQQTFWSDTESGLCLCGCQEIRKGIQQIFHFGAESGLYLCGCQGIRKGIQQTFQFGTESGLCLWLPRDKEGHTTNISFWYRIRIVSLTVLHVNIGQDLCTMEEKYGCILFSDSSQLHTYDRSIHLFCDMQK